ncbi:MAG: hypothetical protein GY792_32685 [Gammaproteobacteria bacterium]|nr:hypothetical protein [Gammaproteobacteria bacterium]
MLTDSSVSEPDIEISLAKVRFAFGAAGRGVLDDRLVVAGSTSSGMAPESGHWKKERIANVGYLESI